MSDPANSSVHLSSSTPRPPQSILLAVALVAAAVLGFEVALTRVFATVLRYHFAFLVISMALCGLGLGGYAAHLARQKKTLSLGGLAVAFSLSVAGSLLLLMRGVFAFFPELYWLSALVVLVPFSLGGAFLAEAFTRHAAHSGRLYAWDLAGASLAALAIVGILQVTSAIEACLLMSVVAIGAAWLCERTPRLPLWTGLVLAFAALNPPLQLLNLTTLPPKFEFIDNQWVSLADKGFTQPLFTELGSPECSTEEQQPGQPCHTSRIIDTRWNAFARTDVVAEGKRPQSGQSELEINDTLLVYTNGNVPTNMVKWDGSLSALPRITREYRLSDWAFEMAPLGAGKARQTPRGKVLAIGPGGGLDALLALRYGADAFYGAEINPSIVGLMREPKYRKFNGDIYGHERVHVQTAEGRAFVRERVRQGEKFSLVYSALTKTATAAQGMALLESFIYTSDAFEDYWQALADDGQISIVLDSPILVARFFVTAVSVMQKHGITPSQACRHVAIVSDPNPGPYQFGIIFQKTPFTRAQTEALFDSSRIRRQMTPIWIPDQAALDGFGPYSGLAAGKIDLPSDVGPDGSLQGAPRPPQSPVFHSGDATLDKFIHFFAQNNPGLDVSPRPDDRPFVLDMSLVTPPIMVNLGYGLGALLLVALAFLLWGMQHDAAMQALRPRDGLYLLYFLALGLGFMIVEIPLIQKLVLPLGYPTLSLTVILFSLLLGGGIGAALSQKFDGARLRTHGALCALLVAGATVGFAFLLPQLDDALLGLALPLRCVIAALLMVPLGICLGTPFPTGLRLFSQERAALVPLIWGLNGVASVCGSFLAALGARSFGFYQMLICGAVIYAVAALILLCTAQKQNSAA